MVEKFSSAVPLPLGASPRTEQCRKIVFHDAEDIVIEAFDKSGHGPPTKKFRMSHNPDAYSDFCQRLKLFITKNPGLVTTTLSNIFTMRLVGNKTHGDLAEIAIAEFINQFMYDFRSLHVGKDLFRAKSSEEDITITNEISDESFPVSLKAYGNGPLQLSTDKSSVMFPRLKQEGSSLIKGKELQSILTDTAFTAFDKINVLPLIYDEKNKRCNIMVFDYVRAIQQTDRIILIPPEGRRKHPVFCFQDRDGQYICEVRYGNARANALQRGLWTHTVRAERLFDSVTSGWIDYSMNPVLVQLFSHALVCTTNGHEQALKKVKEDIEVLKRKMGDNTDAV
jgi:hypothetical protein